MDPLSIVADEVALEGLDGITIPSLWIRLENREPTFPLKLDECTKQYIWRSLISNTDLKFYELPQEREDVVLYDRYKDIDPETGIETRDISDENKEIYPVHIILENKDGIQGSCALFRERKDVTKHVRCKSLAPLVNLEGALERYGRKLVVVASQTLRFRALIGSESDPDLKLNDDSYCLLERVGRARWQGELQSDLHGNSFKTDARKLHYIRKSLVKHGLIGMQSHVTRLKSRQQQHCILLQLKRFFVFWRGKYDIMMESVANLLQQCPGQLATLAILKEELNVNECTFKRLLRHMRAAKLVQFMKIPLEDLDPSAEHCTNKNGSKVLVRCLRLLKPYTRKGVIDDDDDDDDDDEEEESDTGGRRVLPSEGRIMEKDVLSQAYQLVLSCGTEGIPKSGIGFRMNVGKLESRMICRTLEREGLIKGFMVDEGRQRTTKYISHKFVGVSDQLQLFAQEQERKKLLYSSASQTSDTAPATSKTPSTLKSSAASKNSDRGGDKDAEEAQQICDARQRDTGEEGLNNGKGVKTPGKSRRKTTGNKRSSVTAEQTQADIPKPQHTTAECKTTACSKSMTSVTPDSVFVPSAEQAPINTEEQVSSVAANHLPQSEVLTAADNPEEDNLVVVKDVDQLQPPSQHVSRKSLGRSHETYRLLRRKNLIVEAIRNLKIVEGLIPLQKMINEDEKQDGVSSKCCRKTIFRLVSSLCREGLLKIYTTTVIQDGITKKLDMVVHPSIQPNDDIVNRVIEQVRFRISSSYSALRLHQAQEKAREQSKGSEDATTSPSKARKSKADKKRESLEDDEQFKPKTVKGLGKTFGFQPKMHRLRVVHLFLWYLIYGHPLKDNLDSNSETQANSSDPHVQHTDTHDKQDLKDTQPSENGASGSVRPQTAASTTSNLDEDEEQKEKLTPGQSQSNMKVYADEDSWKKFIPPVRVHEEYSSGWAMVGDLLLCLPLSVFTQVIPINYQVDGLEEYLNDPVKQHYIVRALPGKMRRQLLFKRKYLFLFHENLQKLVYMGLLQFGPVEKFKDKDQVFVYLKRKATIVDTTIAEPHYWLVTESQENPFERRQYIFNTAEDIENYWFDLMCVCLNTPLGVIRNKRNATEDEAAPSFVHERNVFFGLAYLLKGSSEVCDDGSIPGDSKGAGGLHSEFFAHLKRNWFWTNHLLHQKKNPTDSEAPEAKTRLNSLLNKNALRIALKAGGTTAPRCVTVKRPVMVETVEVEIESASRNKQVVGGKRQRTKRGKKEVVKVQRKKKKEPKKRTPAHDEADHQALKMMTRQRVYWSIQEDSLMMLCCVASHLLNSKLKRPFSPYCVVRDLLHVEFEISVDKTSVAVGRRSRYILKNPQTLLNYRICLAEVYQDKTLMWILEEKKPADPNKPEDCAAAFSEYVRLLRQKFSSFVNTLDMIMPDTKQELFSRFKVSAIDSGKQVSCKDTLNCTDDIHAIVLHNLIQSTLAMTNSQMKTSRSFQTFHVYSKYNQEVLCQVFINCRKRGLVNRRRVSQPSGPKKNRALPILPMSYQLSQSYYRCFSWRFPYSLCTDSFHFLRSLLNSGSRDDRPVTVFYHETENRAENEEEVLERRSGLKKKARQREGNKDDSAVSEIEKANTELTPGGKNEVQGGDCPTTVLADKQTDDDHLPRQEAPEAEFVGSSTATQGSEDPPNVSDMLQFSLDSPGGACVVALSLMSLGLLSVYVSVPKQMVVVDSNMVDNDVVKSMAALEEEDDDDYDGEECERGKKLEVKAHQASHTNYLVMRGYCCPGIVKLRNLNTNDNIVVESCIMRLQLRSTPAHHMFSVENSPPLDLTKCGPSLLPSVLTHSISSFFSPSSVEESDRRLIQQRGYTSQDIEACAHLRRSLDKAGENGLDIDDLFEALTHLEAHTQFRCSRSLQQYLKDLQEEGQALRTGSLSERWVLIQHAEPWLLTLNSKQRSRSHFTSNRLPFLKNQHNIPFMRKRCRREVQDETEEPPGKKPSVDRQESKDTEDLETQKLGEEKHQDEWIDEGNGDKLVNLEVERVTQTQSREEAEEEAGQEKVETEEKQEERRELRAVKDRKHSERNEKPCSPPTGSADVHDEDNVSFISRPWRMVDGKLNRQVCKGMLEAVLYHIMSQPGLTQQTLVEHYKDVLQPMALLDLVQALIDMGCVTKKTLVKSPKPSLFSCSVSQTVSKTEVKIEELDAVFYEPTISCCLRLSQLLPNERHWNYCMP